VRQSQLSSYVIMRLLFPGNAPLNAVALLTWWTFDPARGVYQNVISKRKIPQAEWDAAANAFLHRAEDTGKSFTSAFLPTLTGQTQTMNLPRPAKTKTRHHQPSRDLSPASNKPASNKTSLHGGHAPLGKLQPPSRAVVCHIRGAGPAHHAECPRRECCGIRGCWDSCVGS